ncbi:zymogen granule protein 16 homolog B [Meriones unguiculatus]|uniref:zymogen granule protein 16 homolog B n=1 Tax=Meriones unguiculatus TaxID=10047 RepID=UPI000B4FC3FF|nr:zymogen granule protein 16 homolog B [Meriones unguiculatus]
MLLLMTLALLASSACRAQNILGNRFGTYFYIIGNHHGELKGIRIFLTPSRHIKGIQLRFGNFWSDTYGYPSLNYKDFLLEDGEHVTKVEGSVSICLNSLNFITNKRRVASFGVKGGRPFEDTGDSNKHLVTINGMLLPGVCIKGMGFIWEHGPDNLVSPKPPRRPMDGLDISRDKEDEDKDSEKNKDKDDDDDDDDDDDEDNDQKKDDNDKDDSDDNDDDDDEDDKKKR